MGTETIWLFLRYIPDGDGPAQLAEIGTDAFRARAEDAAAFRLESEGYPLPEGVNPTIVMPDEWAGEAESRIDTPVATLLRSAEWYFRSRGEDCTVLPFACFGGEGQAAKARVFWLSYPAVSVLPVKVCARTDVCAHETQSSGSDVADNAAAEREDRGVSLPETAFDRSENLQTWRDVYVFISSTFNDMHAERNYLIKRVFPELAHWCAQHRLRLRDIDLRWGITEEDSTVNLRTVQICLDNIDRCRPFFLCFVGQRRGWVPSDGDIAAETFSAFPKLRDNLGCSVTEMEVIHSLIDPMRTGNVFEEDRLTRAYFYLRDPGYLDSICNPALRRVYTNTGSDDPARDDRLLRDFREHTLLETGRPCRAYTCRWDADGKTAELGAVRGALEDITRGALTDFMCGCKPLCDRIIADMKAAITERYGLRETHETQSRLQQELDSQARFLLQAADSFIERPGDLDPFEEYLREDTQAPLIVTGGSGSGKTSLLAHWILLSRRQICYRFVGRSLWANSPAELACSVWEQFRSEGRVSSPPPDNTAAMLERFGDMLGEAAAGRGLILVIDAVDQFPGGVWDAAFLPRRLPAGVKLIVSVKKDAPDAAGFLLDAAAYARILHIRPFNDAADRAALCESYLSNYLKQLNRLQMDTLIASPGAENPLYLKIVLNELRVFGEYDTLTRHIGEDFRDTVAGAFNAMLIRLEGDADCDGIAMKTLVPKVFGWLSHCRSGLTADELAELLVRAGIVRDHDAARGAVLLLARQLRPFLTEKEQRIDFFYDSFREACAVRYTASAAPEIWHGEIAAFLKSRPADDRHRLAELAWQYFMAADETGYMDCVFDYAWLSGKLRFFGVQALIADYSLSSDPDTQRMVSFLGLSGQLVAEQPQQLVPRLHGHLCGVASARIAALLSSARAAQTAPWLRPVNECFEAPGADLSRNFGSAQELSGAVLLRRDTLAASIEDGKTICIWDMETGSVRTRMFVPEEGFFFRRIASAPDGGHLAAYLARTGAKHEAQIIVYETHGFTPAVRFSVGTFGPSFRHFSDTYFRFPDFAFSCDGRAMFIMDEEHHLRAFDLSNGQALCEADDRWSINRLCSDGTGQIAAAYIHPQNDNPNYFRASFERSVNPVRLFRFDPLARTLRQEKTIGEWRSTVEAIALSPDGAYLAGADENDLFIYDTRTGRRVANPKENSVNVLCFLPERRLLLVIGERIALYTVPDFHPVWNRRGLGFVNAAHVSADENSVLLNIGSKKHLRVLSLLPDGETEREDAAPMGIRSVCPAGDGAHIWASAYPNWIAHGNEAVPGTDPEPRLFVFRRDGAYIGQTTLPGRDYRDYVYLSPDGACAVAKLFQEKERYIVNCWPLEDAPKTDGEPALSDNWFFPRRGSRYLDGHPQDIQFSADRRFVSLVDSESARITVLNVRTGRLLGTVGLVRPVSGLRRLFGGGNDVDSTEMWSLNTDVTDGGTMLWALFTCLSHPRLERYSVKTGKRLSSIPLSGEFTPYTAYDYENPLCRVTDGGRRLILVNAKQLLCIDTETGRIQTRIDKKQARCESDDYFAAVSPDGRLAAISGCRAYTDVNWCLQIWDLDKNRCLGEFTADGRIGEIIYEKESDSWLFGMENGRLCRLKPEETEGKSDAR